MFLISNCRGDWDLGLCTTSVLAFGELKPNGKIRFFLRRTRFFLGFCHRAFVLQTPVTKFCTDLDLSLLYILILGTDSKFARKTNFLQPCARRPRHHAAPWRIFRIFLSCCLPVMLITRLSKADKKNRRGRSLLICRTQWPAGIEMRHWNILGDFFEILKGIFEKQEQFSKRIVFAKFDW